MDTHTRTRPDDRQPLAGDRLSTLHRSGLLEDQGPTEAFDRVARLARRLLGAETGLVSLVDAHRQVVRGQDGGRRRLGRHPSRPVGQYYCAYVVATGAALRVRDARRSPLLRRCPAIEDQGAVAYLGVPLRLGAAGDEVGTLSVLEPRARAWTQEDLDVLADLGELASAELERRVGQLDAGSAADLDVPPTAGPQPVDVRSRLRLAVALARSCAQPGDVRARLPEHAVPVHEVRHDLDRALALALVTATHHAEIGSSVQVSLDVEDDRAVVRAACPGTAVPPTELLRMVAAFGPDDAASPVEIVASSGRTRVRGPRARAEAAPDGTVVVARLPLLPGAEVTTALGVRIVPQRRREDAP